MYLAHGAISYILNETVQKNKISKLSKQEQLIVATFSIIFGILPDIDILILSMTSTPSFMHHLLFTHSILFFVLLWALLNSFFWIVKKLVNKETRLVLNNPLVNAIQWSFLIGTLSHIFSDILFSYSRVLFPLEQQITILGGVFKVNYFASYLFTPSFATEVLFLFLFLLLVSKKCLSKSVISKIILYLTIPLSLVYISFTAYMNLNTYNKARHYQDKREVNDMDYDGIKDTHDSDTNNNGIENILEIDETKMADFVQNISIDRYLVTNSDDTIGRIKYLFGAFGSYRLISQAYFEQNLAIEPVLLEYAKSKYNIHSYTVGKSYPTLFYEYLSENCSLNDLNKADDTGKILFVFQKGEVVNMGIVLNENRFGIVLPNDKRLVTHTLEDISGIYKNIQIKVASISQLE